MILRIDTPQKRLLVGYAASLGAAAAYGSSSLIARKIVDDYSSPIVATAFSLLFGTVIMAALFHRSVGGDALRAPRKAWLYVALAGAASTWGVTFMFVALTQAPIVLVAPLTGTNPLVSLVLSHFFLQKLERITLRTVAGAALVVGGVALIAYGNSLR